MSHVALVLELNLIELPIYARYLSLVSKTSLWLAEHRFISEYFPPGNWGYSKEDYLSIPIRYLVILKSTTWAGDVAQLVDACLKYMKPWVQPPAHHKMGVVVMLVISALGGSRRKENEKLSIISGHIESFRSVVIFPWTHRIWPDPRKEAGLWLVMNWLGGSTPAWDTKTKIIPKQNQLPVPLKAPSTQKLKLCMDFYLHSVLPWCRRIYWRPYG